MGEIADALLEINEYLAMNYYRRDWDGYPGEMWDGWDDNPTCRKCGAAISFRTIDDKTVPVQPGTHDIHHCPIKKSTTIPQMSEVFNDKE